MKVACKWVELGQIILDKVTQTYKDKCPILPLIGVFWLQIFQM